MKQNIKTVCTCKVAGAAAEGHSSIGASRQDTLVGSHRQEQAEGYNPGCDEQKAEDVLQAMEGVPPKMQQPQYIAQDKETCPSKSNSFKVRTCTTVCMQYTSTNCLHAMYKVACITCNREDAHRPMLPAVTGVQSCMKGYFCSCPR